MPRSEFVHLHVHTQHSLLDGAIRIPDLIDLAREFKMSTLSITDHGNLFGAMEFYTGVQSQGLKPIIGCETYVAPESRLKHTSKQGETTAHHLILLCENEKGYRNLCRLVSKAYLEGFYYKPRIDKELLADCREGLICLSGCLAGEIPSRILAGDEAGALERAAWFRDLFGPDRYFLELQENKLEDQRRANEGLMRIAAKLDVKLVATNDCHYLRREDHKAHEVLLCIQTGKMMDDPSRMRFETEEFYVKSPKEMAHDFRHVPDAIKNTLVVAERCNLLLQFDEIHMPRFDPGTGETLRERFEKSTRKGWEERSRQLVAAGGFDDDKRRSYEERLDREIRLIHEMGYSGYFLIVADFIGYARKSGVPVGPGRGSAAGSLAAYSLGITDIDPIKYTLLFERFLNPERKSMPDIDVDFCMDGRERVIDYVTKKYGVQNVAQIITFGRMQAKAVVRDVARVMGMPYSDGDRIAKLIPDELKITLDKAIAREPKLAEEIKTNPRVAELISAAKSLEGLSRHASTHAAGIVIADRPLMEILPLYRGSKGETMTQFDMNWVEKIGLVKFDFLGLKTLTVIDRALKLIEESRNEKLDLSAIPFDDAETYALLSRGDTMGVFQLESSGMREMLTKFKPSVFEDLIAILALYRPGPLDSGMVDDFINRKHGRTSIEYPLPELEPVLKETYGVIVYQEQVMNIAVTLAGYSLGDADLLRRAMGKKKPEEMARQKDQFEKGAAKNKIPPDKATYIFELMEKFAGYGFNKSHSAAYAMVSYQTAYLKTHYTAEFMAAQLTCESGNTDKITQYISECRERGIEVLPPHVNQSENDFVVRKGKIVFGMGAVKNVGRGAVEAVIKVRKKDGPFRDLQDFACRVDLRKVNKKVMESLVKCGAFDGSGHSRQAMGMGLDAVLEEAQKHHKEKAVGQFNLFQNDASASYDGAGPRVIPDVSEWEDLEKLGFEKDILGFYVTGHPLMKYEDLIKKYSNASSMTLSTVAPSTPVRIAGLIKKTKEHNTKKGDRMAFITLEDLWGVVEVTVFSDLYGRAGDILQSGEPVLMVGTKEGEGDGNKILANDLLLLRQAPQRLSNEVHIRILSTGTDASHIQALKRIMERNKGPLPVFLHVIIQNRTETVISAPGVRCEASEALVGEIDRALGYQAVSFQ
ncbi:MAG: DNA polymerase III subunit alpha [Pseudomonadota bacterium]